MSLSSYLLGIRFFTFFALSALTGIIFLFDPYEIGKTGFLLFALALFVVLMGMSLLLLISLYRRMLSDEGAVANLMGILRQSCLLAIFFVGLVFFQYMHILVWWDSALLLVMILLLEFTFRYLSHP